MIFPDVHKLLDFLEASHQPDQHLYRGQLKRYPPHLWNTGDKSYEIEAVYPADFRFIYEHSQPSEELFRKVSSARAFGREVRDQFVVGLLSHLSNSVGDNQ